MNLQNRYKSKALFTVILQKKPKPPQTLKKSTPLSTYNQGFALVVTLTLMVLLSILALGMLSLSSVALRTAGAQDNELVARANARLGLIVALNQLQTQLGPDQRITARGESFAADSYFGVTVSPQTPGALWVGVANGEPGTPPDLGKPLPDGKKVDWLVSGVTGTALGNASLNKPVDMFTAKSIDLVKYTGGTAVVSAGRVPIKDVDNKTTGNYAYFTDDEGMKAQLVPANSKASNSTNAGLGLLAAGYDLGALENLSALQGISPAQLGKAMSIRDLELLGAAPDIASQKHFDFTTTSLGVLSDTRNGGLRKDLTIAFENDNVFSNVFPQNDNEKFLLLRPERLAQASDLSSKGYINWQIFKDYYNMKTSIQGTQSSPFMNQITFLKDGFYNQGSTNTFFTGRQGPHAMTPPSSHAGHPYGDFDVMQSSGGTQNNYRHSPFSPVLALLQMSAWVEPKEGMEAKSASDPQQVMKYWYEGNTQLWTSHYNPYNMPMRFASPSGVLGPRVMNFPHVIFRVPKYSASAERGLHNKRQTSVSAAVTIAPGRSQVMGLSTRKEKGQEIDDGPYSQNVRQIVAESVYVVSPKTETKPLDPIKVNIDFVMDTSSFLHGVNEHPGDSEVAANTLHTHCNRRGDS